MPSARRDFLSRKPVDATARSVTAKSAPRIDGRRIDIEFDADGRVVVRRFATRAPVGKKKAKG